MASCKLELLWFPIYPLPLLSGSGQEGHLSWAGRVPGGNPLPPGPGKSVLDKCWIFLFWFRYPGNCQFETKFWQENPEQKNKRKPEAGIYTKVSEYHPQSYSEPLQRSSELLIGGRTGPWSPKGDEGEGPAGRIRSLAEGCLVWSSLCKASSKVNAMMARWQEGEWMTVNQKKYRFLLKRFLPLPAQHQVTRRTNAPSYLFSHIIFF